MAMRDVPAAYGTTALRLPLVKSSNVSRRSSRASARIPFRRSECRASAGDSASTCVSERHRPSSSRSPSPCTSRRRAPRPGSPRGHRRRCPAGSRPAVDAPPARSCRPSHDRPRRRAHRVSTRPHARHLRDRRAFELHDGDGHERARSRRGRAPRPCRPTFGEPAIWVCASMRTDVSSITHTSRSMPSRFRAASSASAMTGVRTTTDVATSWPFIASIFTCTSWFGRSASMSGDAAEARVGVDVDRAAEEGEPALAATSTRRTGPRPRGSWSRP